MYEGKEYDFVFDIDVDEGKVLKLPYNRDQDPYTVAQKFIHDHDMPQVYLDQIANFIYKNAGKDPLVKAQIMLKYVTFFEFQV